MVIVVEGNKNEISYCENEIKEKVKYFTDKNMSKKDAIDTVSEIYHIRKNQIKDIIK